MTVSSLLRQQAMIAIGKGPHFTGPELEVLRACRSELSAIGSNLNQVAKALNILAYPNGVAGTDGCVDEPTLERVATVINGLIPAIAKTRDAFTGMVAKNK